MFGFKSLVCNDCLKPSSLVMDHSEAFQNSDQVLCWVERFESLFRCMVKFLPISSDAFLCKLVEFVLLLPSWVTL